MVLFCRATPACLLVDWRFGKPKREKIVAIVKHEN